MDARQMKDPASGVPQPLLQHLHLVSKNRYPMLPNPSLEAVVSYLLEAPKVMREMQPVQWQFLDAPPDNTMLLVWHPAQHLGDNFATDGYVWTDVEQSFDSDVRGCKLQMLWHRAGYKPQVENVAVHSRRRYRLLPNNQMGMPSPDPNFWLIHYSKANPRDQQPAPQLSMYPQLAAQFQQRRLIQASGQIPRKEFMLNDRANWPVIHAPAAVARAAAASGQMGGHRRAGSVAHEASVEEEEDVSRGDALDFMTPRDISRTRYEQHHEWMEEVLESPYGTKHIVPPEIGLGRKGALESLTDGFFTAPLSSATDPVMGPVGKLDAGKADEFTKRANQKIAEMQAELEKMKERHIKRMEKLKRTTEIAAAEKKLRSISGPPANGQDPYAAAKEEAEQILGRTIEPVSNVQCISKGGTQEMRPPTPPPAPAVPTPVMAPVPLTQQPSTENQTQAQPQAQQQPPQQSFAAGQQPSPGLAQQAQIEQPQSQDSSASSQNGHAQSTDQLAPPQPDQTASGISSENTPAENEPTPNEAGDLLAGADIDVDMSGLDDDQVDMPDNMDAGDWDMLNDEPLPDTETGTEALEPPEDVESQKEVEPAPTNNQPQELSTADQQGEQSEPQPEQQLPQPDTEQASTQQITDDAGTFDMVNDFDDIDTAGDALADYGGGDDLDLNDSAFGDAFHHNEHEES